MPTSKSAKARMDEAVKAAIANGDSFLANEITANVMVGTTMVIVYLLLAVCFVLNEFGVFTVDKTDMRLAFIAATVVEVPITVVNSIYVGTKPWLRRALLGDLTVVCAILSWMLGHNVTLVMLLPMLISTRYFDRKYTVKIALFTAALFLLAAVGNGIMGVKNLNVYHFTTDVTVTAAAGDKLRDVLADVPLDTWTYVKDLLINEFAPRCLAFLAMTVTCAYVSQRGRDMIVMESERTKNTARIETELDLATKIQTSMLPCIFPAFPDHKNIELKAVYYPAKEVGGDFYDYFIVDATHVGLVTADVSGKGVGAALFMTISKTVIKNQLQLGISPAEAITRANKQLCENNDAGLFVTCWAGVYDTETGKLTFVNAGHTPPVIIRKGKTPQFVPQRSGFVLAGMEDFKYREEEIELRPGDEVFFYTDGVTEATDSNLDQYGNDRLLDCLENCRSQDVTGQLDHIKKDIDAFVGGAEQFDDITVMGMKITE